MLSVIATVSVVVVPTFTAFALLVFSQPQPYVLAAIIVSVVLTAGAAFAGAALWARQPESAGVAFGDLMLWSWVRHRNAERVLERSLQTLGFDREGRSLDDVPASGEAQLAALLGVSRALDAKSSYTLGHSQRVERHACRVVARMDLPSEEVGSVSLAARLHDVGTIALEADVLRKVGRLSAEERSDVEDLVAFGATMVEGAGRPDVAKGIRHHRERWDGGGYPDGLRGSGIPLSSRIIAVAEAYDAMTSTRPYRQGLTPADAIERLRSESGSQFDPDVVEAFISTVRRPVPFLAVTQGRLREVGLVFRRIGAVALSAAVSTVAIALILGSSVLSPGTFRKAPSTELAQQEEASDAADRVLGTRVVADEQAISSAPEGSSETGLSGDDGASAPSAVLDAAAETAQGNSIEGPAMSFDGGDAPSGGGSTEPGGGSSGPGGGTSPPSPGGGSTGSGGSAGGGSGSPPAQDPDPEPTPQPTPQPEPSQSPSEGGESKERPGNSGSAPGHNKDGDRPGNSGNAPGHNKDDKEKP